MKESLTQKRMKELFDYDGKALIWRERPLHDFSCEHWKNWWNSRFAGKKAGGLQGYGYVSIQIGRRSYPAHRLIFLRENGWLPAEIDHINGVRDDNRLANLRAADRSINQRNQKLPANNKSGRLGVFWRPDCGRWRAQIGVNKRVVNLGSFESFEEACEAREAAEIKYGYHPNHGRAA